MKDMKLSNIQKESEKIKIKKSINEYEDLKSQVVLLFSFSIFLSCIYLVYISIS